MGREWGLGLDHIRGYTLFPSKPSGDAKYRGSLSQLSHDMGAPVGGRVAGKLRHSTHFGSISTNPVSTSFF